jgi:hypothetical protein
MKLRHLAITDRHISQGAQDINLQRRIVALMEVRPDVMATYAARSLLNTMLDTQAVYEQHRDAILRELDR